MEFLGLLALLALIWFLWITVSAARSASRINHLNDIVGLQQQQLQKLRDALTAQSTDAPAPPPVETPVVEPEPIHEPAPVAAPASAGWGRVPPVQPQKSQTTTAKSSASFEQKFGTRWTVWLGGVAVALGALFLVQYSVQSGFFTPEMRLFMAFVVSVVLLTLGEVMRRRPQLVTVPNVTPAQIPPILTASGLVAAYGATYAAYALYGLIGPAPAFFFLGALSVAAILLAGLHASYVGAIGLFGAIAAPLLIESDTPRPEVLFIYLTFVLATAMITNELRQWHKLAMTTLALSAVWPLLWIAGPYQAGDELIVGLHMLLLYGLRVALSKGEDTRENTLPHWVLAAYAFITGVILLMLITICHYTTLTQGLFATFAFASLIAAWGRDKFIWAYVVSVILTIIVTTLWQVPSDALTSGFVESLQSDDFQTLLSDARLPFLWASLVAGISYALSGFLRLIKPQGSRPATLTVWALTSAFAPLVLFLIAYARVTRLEPSPVWAIAALALATLAGAATHVMAQRRAEKHAEFASACYATVTLAFISTAFAITLRNEWLTIALALLVPGVAWIQTYLPVRFLERLAMVMAGVVTVRLTLNPALGSYDFSSGLLLNTLLYTYGLPAAALGCGAWFYRHMRRDEPADTLEAGAILLGVLLLNLEINHAFSGGVAFSNHIGLTQLGSHVIVWFMTSLTLQRLHMRQPRWHYHAGATLLRGLALAGLAIALTFFNPLFHVTDFNRPMFFDPMFNGYLLPALLAAYSSWLLRNEKTIDQARVLIVVAGLALFTYYTLEVRRLFHDDSIMLGQVMSDAENYAYSAAWLILGGLTLVAAFLTSWRPMRLLSLSLVMLVVVKVFIFDLASLSGILRALSFLGLGGSLIAIGRFYQQVVFRAPLIKEE